MAGKKSTQQRNRASRAKPKLDRILDRLEESYGSQRAAGPTDPYRMIVYLNCGYPATDASCAKGFAALRRAEWLTPRQILAAPKAKLSKLLKTGGFVPELRAQRLKQIARKTQVEYGLDLAGELKKRLGRDGPGGKQGLREANQLLREFPTIGEPGAEKILLFARLAPVAAVPSASVGVPIRLYVGQESGDYRTDYRAAREILESGLARSFPSRQRAYLLLKRHGQQICRRSSPRCEICPVASECAYFARQALDENVERQRAPG